MFHSRLSLIWVCLGASFAGAQEVVYVTDLSIFTVLAPCAAAAVSENVQAQTNQNCPEAVTDLQSCVCTKNNNFASISTRISSSVSRSCGSTASEDQASAASVFAAYCNQETITPFPTPSNPVTQYITDFPAWQELAPCAANGLSYIVQSMTYDLCPAEPSLLATCVCKKNQNSLLASQGINKSVKSSCSSHIEDIDSAQAVFSAYCGLIKGISSFPTTSDPPGDMTYHITALSEYSSLAPCAQSAVSYGVLSQTYDLCPDGPKALASCACLKSSMSGFMRNVIISDVKYSCDSTATEDVSSALAVLELYCNAAKGLITPVGITESSTATLNTGASGPKETGVAGGSENSNPENTKGPLESEGPGGDSINKSNTGVIVGAVVGALAGLALIGLAAFFLWRRRQYSQTVSPSVNLEFSGKPELDGSQNLGGLKNQEVTSVNNILPLSAYSSPNSSELQGHSAYTQPPIPQIPELRGQNHAIQIPSPASQYIPQEAYGLPVHEAPAQREPQVYEAYGQPRSELQGMGRQSGPMTEFHEVDGGYRG